MLNKLKSKPNGNRTAFKMHVKTGDVVQVISGSYKGKVGKILKVFPETSQVIVEDVNNKTKHLKAQREGEAGQIVTREFPIHSSKVMIYSEKEKKASRVCYTFTDDGKKVRMLKKTGEILDKK
ncbi:50S ribosomal protein L24 [Tumidithrix helvetica PCC 7403]|uniref:50S ribosomal protein L24 n=1 Tax=Tumidithrix helvetica TaxID=3457545 RepID=UPI003C911E43